MRSLNEFLAAAPGAMPLCGEIAALVSVNDVADREARALADGRSCRWAAERSNGSTRRICRMPGNAASFRAHDANIAVQRPVHRGRRRSLAITEADILEPSERFGRRWTTTRTRRTGGKFDALAETRPPCWRACMAAPGAATAGRC